MRNDSVKLLMLAGVIAFAVLYGMDLSTRGIERVYGPLDYPMATAPSAPSNASGDWTLPPRQNRPQTIVYDSGIVIPRQDKVPLIDRVSSATAKTLHEISSGGIRFVVSLFDKVTGS